MSVPASLRILSVVCFVAFLVNPGALEAADSSPLRYTVSLAHPENHLLHVSIMLPAGEAQRDLQLPVWNALYQVRDFSQFISWVRAKDHAGRPLEVRLLNKSCWRIRGAGAGTQIDYEILANDPGPYGAQLNEHHAFFNLAEILMYPVEARSSPVELGLVDVPPGWRTATSLALAKGEFLAENYDHLVDAPVELGRFQETAFEEGGGHYRIVVDADAADYDMQKISAMVRRIVSAASNWMDDRPFDGFLFIYHFPRGPGGGGMEHAYSTAIDVNAQVAAADPEALADVTAHEFFHLWNVKRIRPQSMEPVDYTKENYSDALWFSEGVTNTAQEIILLRANFIDQQGFLNHLAENIEALESRPARLTQSAEESSLDAWLEKYPAYRSPRTSISYYNKGDLLGTMLDLEVREASRGKASLRDVFQWMNQNYARQGRPFPDSEGVRQAAEQVCGADLRWFFEKYVAGTDEIPWNEFFKTVGLQAVSTVNRSADLSFTTSDNPGSLPMVSAIDPDGRAASAGLAVGDLLLEINGRVVSSSYRRQLASVRADETLRLRVRSGGGVERGIAWKVDSREQVDFELKDLDNVTWQQKARRAAWLRGEDQPSEARPSVDPPRGTP